MALKGYILLTLLISMAAEDLAFVSTNTADNILDNNVIDPLDEIDYTDPLDTVHAPDRGTEKVSRSFLASWQARKSLRKILAQMPCGWSEYGIPPFAPYVNQNLSIQFENDVLRSEMFLKFLRIDGLDNMQINRLTVGVIFKRAYFDFNFPNITFKGNFDTTTLLNLEDFIGTKFLAKSNGTLELRLENLRIKGILKYHLPIFFGSAEITKINAEFSLGNVSSALNGTVNDAPIGQNINHFIVTEILRYVNDHDYLWNGLIEKQVLPVINAQLEGQTLWKLFLWSTSSSVNACKQYELTDLDIKELHQLLLKQRPSLAKVADENDYGES